VSSSFCALIILSSFIFFLSLGQEKEISSREIRHAEIAREMAESGNYIIPYLLGKPYTEKPPLFNCCVAFLFKITNRVNLFIARIPSAISAIAAMVGIYLLAMRWFSEKTALYSALIWSTSWIVVKWGRVVRMDMMMSCLILYGVLFYDLITTSPQKNMRILFTIITSLMMGTAVLSKGPYAVVFFGITVLAIEKSRNGRWLPPLCFCLIFAGIIFLLFTLWAIIAEIKNPGHIRAFIDYQFGQALIEHRKRFYLYFDQLLIKALPWSLLTPGAIWWSIKEIREGNKDHRIVPFLTFAGGITFLTIVQNKRPHYMLPIIPMWAIMVAAFIEYSLLFKKERLSKNGFYYPLLFFLAIWSIAAVVFFILLGSMVFLGRGILIDGVFKGWQEEGLMWMMALLAISSFISIAGIRLIKKDAGKALLVLFILASFLSITIPTFLGRYFPENEKEIKTVEDIISIIPVGVRVGTLNARYEYLYFKLNRRVRFFKDADELEAFIKEPGIEYVILENKNLEMMRELIGNRLVIKGKWKTDKCKITLLSTTK